MKEHYVGLTRFKEEFLDWVEALEIGESEAVIILRHNKPAGVMLSFDAYKQLATPTELERSLLAKEAKDA